MKSRSFARSLIVRVAVSLTHTSFQVVAQEKDGTDLLAVTLIGSDHACASDVMEVSDDRF